MGTLGQRAKGSGSSSPELGINITREAGEENQKEVQEAKKSKYYQELHNQIESALSSSEPSRLAFVRRVLDWVVRGYSGV